MCASCSRPHYKAALTKICCRNLKIIPLFLIEYATRSDILDKHSPIPKTLYPKPTFKGLYSFERKPNRSAHSKLAAHVNFALMGFDDVLGNSQAQTRPALLPRTARVDAVKSLK